VLYNAQRRRLSSSESQEFGEEAAGPSYSNASAVTTFSIDDYSSPRQNQAASFHPDALAKQPLFSSLFSAPKRPEPATTTVVDVYNSPLPTPAMALSVGSNSLPRAPSFSNAQQQQKSVTTTKTDAHDPSPSTTAVAPSSKSDDSSKRGQKSGFEFDNSRLDLQSRKSRHLFYDSGSDSDTFDDSSSRSKQGRETAPSFGVWR